MNRTLALGIVLALMVGTAIAQVIVAVAGPDGARRVLHYFGAECSPCEDKAQPRDAQVDRRWRVAQSLLRGEELVSSIERHVGSVAQGRTDIATSTSDQQGRAR